MIFSKIFIRVYNVYIYIYMHMLVGGFKHFLFSIISGMSSFPLTFIFFKMVKTINQIRSGYQSPCFHLLGRIQMPVLEVDKRLQHFRGPGTFDQISPEFQVMLNKVIFFLQD
jgi:hypothetical protein